jgi:hypothetical protein
VNYFRINPSRDKDSNMFEIGEYKIALKLGRLIEIDSQIQDARLTLKQLKKTKAKLQDEINVLEEAKR